MRRRGFTLVEVLVALVVLEVGLLGVVGTLLLAAATVREAWMLEEGVLVMEGVLDGVRAGAEPPSGRRTLAVGEVTWEGGPGGSLVLELRDAEGRIRATVHGAGPAGDP